MLLEDQLRSDVVVCILFFNKVEQTLECIRSFAPAGVAIHVLDNGSEPAARAVLDAGIRALPQVRVEETGRNLGCAGGRNRQIRGTTQRWLFFVDNDITIATNDWLQRVALAISLRPDADVLVPRMYNKHDDTWGGLADFLVDGEGNCTFVSTGRPFANSFPGGASIVDRRLFERCGVYDEDIFVGFEDFELAIRAWKSGTPVLSTRCEGVELIHDHRASIAAHDKAAAKVRYDVNRITVSHRVIQAKHGVLLNPNFSDWLAEQIAQVTGERVGPVETSTVKEFRFGQLLPVITPIRIGSGRALVLFVPSGRLLDDWLRLRSVALARQFAEVAGVSVHVRVLVHDADSSRNDWLQDARAAGLFDEVMDPRGPDGTFGLGSLDGFQVGLVHVRGLVSADCIALAMQVAEYEPDGCSQLMIPELRVEFGPEGSGRRLLARSFDVLMAGDAAGEVPLVAAHIDQLRRIDHARYRARARSVQDLLALWFWEAARWGGRPAPLRGALTAECATTGARGEPGPWVPGHWTAQLNLQPLLRHLRGGGTVWNALPIVELPAPQRSLLPGGPLDRFRCEGVRYLVLLPWLRRGGADRAALAYLRVLGERFPNQVLAITTEPVESPWSAYMPPGAQLLQWREVADCAAAGDRVRALLQFIVESRVQVLHVMNSMLGWQLLAEHGRQIRTFARVYASLFWYGPSPPNQLLGYAADFLPQVEGAVDGVITDNETFRLRLMLDYGVSRARTWCVYHPTSDIVEGVTSRGTDARPTVLWAGRFAPEKRLDLLRSIAERLRTTRFRIFGSVEHSRGSEHQELERLGALPNVTLEGPFDGFSALPYGDADLMLYTSSSDGMPNVVVEAAAHGLAIVASDVGGVSELVNAASGWLVSPSDNVDAYLSAIETALGNPAERSRRASIALQIVRQRHTFDAFANQLASVPGYLAP